MSFTIFQDSTTAIASKVNDNFYYIAQGSRLPYGGQSLTSTDSIYDLGSSSARWSTVYCNNLDVASGVTGTAKLWFLKSETDLDTATSRVEVSGFNGDTNIEYMIIVRGVGFTDTAASIGLFINGDTGSNYGMQWLNGIDAATSALNTNGASEIELLRFFNQTTGVDEVGFCVCNIFAETGKYRTVLVNACESCSETFVYRTSSKSAVWTNDSTTITSFVFAAVDALHDGLGGGTHIEVWER